MTHMRTFSSRSILVLMALVSGALAMRADEVAWRGDVAQAVDEAQQQGKLVWLHIGADWCQPCRSLESFVFRNPNLIREANALVIPVKVDFDHATRWVEKYQVDSIPFDVLLDASGEAVIRRRSPHTADDFIAMFRTAADAHRAKLASLGRPISDNQNALANNTNHGARPQESTSPPASSTTVPAEQSSVASSLNSEPFVNTLRRKPAEQRIVNPYVENTAARVEGHGAVEQTSAATAAPGSAPPVNTAQPATSQAAPPTNPAPAKPAIALGGDCPVTLILENRWVAGDPQFGCQHRGQTYLFASAEYLDKFWSEPDRFSPMLAGYDPVIFHETGRLVLGDKTQGVFMHVEGQQQIVLFQDETTRGRFRTNPAPYLETVQRLTR